MWTSWESGEQVEVVNTHWVCKSHCHPTLVPWPNSSGIFGLMAKQYLLSRLLYHLHKAISPTSLKHTHDIWASRSHQYILKCTCCYYSEFMIISCSLAPNCQIPYQASLISLLFQNLSKVSSCFFTHSKHHAPPLTNHFQWVTFSHNPQQKQKTSEIFSPSHHFIHRFICTCNYFRGRSLLFQSQKCKSFSLRSNLS